MIDLNKRFSLENKRALITGASKGIGFGIAEAFVAAGADVTIVARNEDTLISAQKALLKYGTQVDITSFDVSKVHLVHEWFSEVASKWGAPDILVNNAGVARRGPVENMLLEDWNQLMALNVNSVFALSQAFGLERIAAGKSGCIVNIASIQSYVSRVGTAAYCTTKGAIANLTKGLAVDWAQKGIRVNAIAPGFIATPMTDVLQSNDTFDSWLKERCPQGRWGEVSDIGCPAVFLASDAASFITGTILAVDGGFLASM